MCKSLSEDIVNPGPCPYLTLHLGLSPWLCEATISVASTRQVFLREQGLVWLMVSEGSMSVAYSVARKVGPNKVVPSQGSRGKEDHRKGWRKHGSKTGSSSWGHP